MKKKDLFFLGAFLCAGVVGGTLPFYSLPKSSLQVAVPPHRIQRGVPHYTKRVLLNSLFPVAEEHSFSSEDSARELIAEHAPLLTSPQKQAFYYRWSSPITPRHHPFESGLDLPDMNHFIDSHSPLEHEAVYGNKRIFRWR